MLLRLHHMLMLLRLHNMLMLLRLHNMLMLLRLHHMLLVLLWLSPACPSSTRPAVIALCRGAKSGNMFQASCKACAVETLHGCYAGGDDFDNVIVDWLIKEHLRPAVSPPGMLPCHVPKAA